MAASHDTSGAGAAPIHDQRATPRGVLPRSLQMWLMVGLAVIILGIILFTGRAAPLPRASAAMQTAEPSLMPPDRIQAYQRQLAEDEARLRRTLAQAPASARGEKSAIGESEGNVVSGGLAEVSRVDRALGGAGVWSSPASVDTPDMS